MMRARQIRSGCDIPGTDGRAGVNGRQRRSGAQSNVSRRALLESLLVAPLPFVSPQHAEAIGIDSIYEAFPGLYSAPSPVLVPRRTLSDKAFAVALLRSGYEAMDDLNCQAMDEWQKEFWLRRRAEWEPYEVQNEPLRIEQGELSSPLYFDFIAAMQYATVDHSLREPKQRFKEFCGEECGDSQYRIVTRDDKYSDNARLPQFFAERVGENVYGKLRQLSTPLPVSLDDSDGLEGPGSIAMAVAQYFTAQGFALRSEVEGNAPIITIKTTGAATLWALQYLSSRGSRVLPLYDVAVFQYVLKERLGISSTAKLVDLSDTSLKVEIRVVDR